MPRADFITGLVLMLLGVAVVWASLDMPRFEERNANPYTAPGLVPGASGRDHPGARRASCSCARRAPGAGAWRGRLRRAARTIPASGALPSRSRSCLVYAGGLVGTVPFWLATFLFITAFVILFEWPLATDRADRARRLAFAPLLAAVIAVGVTALFQYVFLVRLP